MKAADADEASIGIWPRARKQSAKLQRAESFLD
jgi:hypothetical protein